MKWFVLEICVVYMVLEPVSMRPVPMRLFFVFSSFFCFSLFPQKPGMPKSDKLKDKLKYLSAVACGVNPMTDHPDQKKWFDYGKETGYILMHYQNAKTKDPALLQEVMQRCETEATGWLEMKPPDYAGAAKQYINLEGHMFATGHDSAAIQQAMLRTDYYISLSGPQWQNDLLAVAELNREAVSMLPCCACCGKSAEEKRFFCGKCGIAVYCGKECQKQHWDKAHRELCGKQKMCAACKKLLENPMLCGRCNTVSYCNKAHQTWHWKHGHKKECVPCKGPESSSLSLSFAALLLSEQKKE
jgi:hypothetical protein